MKEFLRVSLGIGVAIFVAGCSAPEFTETDLGQVREVDAGSVFRISLPADGEWAAPRLKGSIVQWLNQRRVGSDDRNVFEFKAESAGEIELLIPARRENEKDRDFCMRIRVLEDLDILDRDDDEEWSRWSRYGDD